MVGVLKLLLLDFSQLIRQVQFFSYTFHFSVHLMRSLQSNIWNDAVWGFNYRINCTAKKRTLQRLILLPLV